MRRQSLYVIYFSENRITDFFSDISQKQKTPNTIDFGVVSELFHVTHITQGKTFFILAEYFKTGKQHIFILGKRA